jgi:hypothetical protein
VYLVRKMEELYITEQELEYLTNIPGVVCEDATLYKRKSQKSFEEEAKNCITLEEFSKMWEESINRLIPK